MNELGSEVDTVHLSGPHGEGGVCVLGVSDGCSTRLTQTTVLKGGGGGGGGVM